MKKKLIFIAYAFFPNKEVAANRIRFWVYYLLKYYPNIEPVVITATPFSKEEKMVENQYYVAEKKSSLSSFLIKDQGLNWRKPLIEFFRTNQFEDVFGIVLTGGPFMQFSIIPSLKKMIDCNIVIDFRDPFSDNQRFHSSRFKVGIKRYFEKKFVQNADYVITVNQDCFNSMAGYYNNNSKFHVIPNGFDEYSIENAKQKYSSIEKTKNSKYLILTGKYYNDAKPFPTFQAIKELREEGIMMNFVHYGGWEEGIEIIPGDSFIIEKGITDYTEIADALVQSDIGVLMTEGIGQNSPTKIFDYIGAELPILIITSGEPYSGNVHSITKDYPLVIWSKNNKNDIKDALRELDRADLKIIFKDRMNYSRRIGLNSLIKILEK